MLRLKVYHKCCHILQIPLTREIKQNVCDLLTLTTRKVDKYQRVQIKDAELA